MGSLSELQQRFAGAAGIDWTEPAPGMPKIRLRNDAAVAEVFLHGATVTHFQPVGDEPLLFLSSSSLFQPDKAIRGGIPICWPWFGPKWDDPKAPQHGVARTRCWDLADVRRVDATRTDLLFRLDVGFAYAEYRVRVGPSLRVDLTTFNRSTEPLRVEEALHTYLTVGDSRQVSISGLSGATYIDKVAGGERKRQGEAPIRFTAETDRVYLDTVSTCLLSDPVLKRTVVVSKSGSSSTVVWNPWVDKSRAFSDFGDDEWQRMCCIETANAADNHLMLEPGGSHAIGTEIRIER
jgi:glucose-6-phosphate 1-epimerase